MNFKNKMVFALLALALSACSHLKKEQAIDKQIAEEPRVYSQNQIAANGHEILMNHPSLSEAQRREMHTLFGKVYAESVQLRNELGKTKAVFFKTLLEPKQNDAEMGILKKKLMSMNDKKMEIMIKALDEAKKILGKNPEVMNELIRSLDKVYPN